MNGVKGWSSSLIYLLLTYISIDLEYPSGLRYIGNLNSILEGIMSDILDLKHGDQSLDTLCLDNSQGIVYLGLGT